MGATYDGSYVGSLAGSWHVTIDGGGAISGWVTSPSAPGEHLPVAGQMETGGNAIITGAGSAAGTSFAALVDPSSGAMSGTWSHDVWDVESASTLHLSGTFTGGRSAATYAYTYSGTYGGTDAGTWTATVSAVDGTVNGSGYSTVHAQPFTVSGHVTGGGVLDAQITSSGGASTGATWSALFLYDGTVTGSWQNGLDGGGVAGSRK